MTTTAKKDYKPTHVIEGTVRWAKIQSPDDNNKYTVDMILDAKGIALMESLGIPVKTDKNDDSIKFVTMTRHAFNPDGEPKPFRIIDAKLQPFTELVGNGSVCRIEFFDREWAYGKGALRKTGVQAYMVGFQVKELVPFIKKNVPKLDSYDEDMESNKFTAKAK